MGEKIFGSNNTVIRGGYGRIYGRLNGVDLMLVPLLGPGLLQAVACVGPTSNGQCGGTGGANASDGVPHRRGRQTARRCLRRRLRLSRSRSSRVRFRMESLNAAAADGSQLDPNLKPNHSDEFTFSIQRSISSKLMLEVGYIGRKISNEFQEINIDAVPG